LDGGETAEVALDEGEFGSWRGLLGFVDEFRCAGLVAAAEVDVRWFLGGDEGD
jgi:hypothetical protein